MATYARFNLSGSTNGLPIPVAATASPGTQIHQALAGVNGFDEVYLWASNVTGSAATLTLQWGGVTDPANDLTNAYSIPANSIPIAIAVGQILQNGVNVKAWSGTASAINLTGFVNRIT